LLERTNAFQAHVVMLEDYDALASRAFPGGAAPTSSFISAAQAGVRYKH